MMSAGELKCAPQRRAWMGRRAPDSDRRWRGVALTLGVVTALLGSSAVHAGTPTPSAGERVNEPAIVTRTAAPLVLAPGQEAMVAKLLGERPPVVLAGCHVIGAAIEATRVVARYGCPGVDGEVIVELRHNAPSNALPAGAMVVLARPPAPAALGPALAKRVAADSTGLRWQKPIAAHPRAHPLPPKHMDKKDPSAVELGMAPATEAAYEASMVEVGSGNFPKLLHDMMALARRDPHPLVIGRLVVACAGVADGDGARARVEQLIADAEAHPEDALRQLVAGVAVHYRGHHTGATVAAKMADYRLALRYLGRTNDAFANSARYWLYTAVSHFRLGEQAQAEAAMVKSTAADLGTDADVFYCRAEIFHRKDPARSVADIKRYRAMMTVNKRNGGFSAPEKDQRVGAMQARLEQLVAGGQLAEGERLFDPLHEAGARPPATLLVALLGLLVALVTAVVLWRRRR